MFSKILLRLTKEALFPAVLILLSKVAAIMVFVHAFSLAWGLEVKTFVPDFVFENQDVSVFVNSYSNLFVFLVVVFGFAWVLARAYYFHDTHIKPSLILRLLSWNLTGLLTSSHEIYHKGIVWISYLWLITLLIGVHTLLGINYIWIFVFALASTILATWYFIADVEREIIHHESTI